MITIQKINDSFYLKAFSTDSSDFNRYIETCRKYHLSFDSLKKSYTASNPKILLEVVDELSDEMDTFIKDSIRKEINDYNPYVPSFKPRRLKIEKSFFEKFPPKGDYQIEDATRMACYGRMINANEMGLGKTYETVQTINQLFFHSLADRVLIVTIPSTLYNWNYEIQQFSDLFNEDDFLIITEANRQKIYEKDLPKIVIISYNTFKLCSDYCYKQQNKEIKKYRKAQIDFSWWGTNRILICDEIHTAKNMDTRWTQILHMHKQYFEYRYGLSGTPSPNGIHELYSPIKFIDDNLVDKNYIDFLRTIGDVGTKYSKYALASIDEKKAKTFYDRIKPYVIRRFLRDHIDLPRVHRKNIYIELSGIHKQIYQSVVNDSLTQIKEQNGVLLYKDLQMKFPYILQSLSDPLLIQDKILELSAMKSLKFESCVKVLAMDNLISDLFSEQKDRKIIVWGTHPETLNRLGERYGKYKPIVIHGGNTPKTEKDKYKWRHEQILDFKKNNSRMLIANPSVLGTGVNIAFANAIIHYDRNFNFTENKQSDGRMERIGLNEEATIYNLIVANSLEIHLEKSLENKQLVDELFLKTGYLTKERVKDIFNPK